MKNNKQAEEWSKEDQNNIVEFFDLLLKIDMRHNPEKYARKKKHGKKYKYSDELIDYLQKYFKK